MKNATSRPIAGLLLLFAFTPLLPAQTAPANGSADATAAGAANPPLATAPAAPSSGDAAPSDEVLKLSDFIVTSTAATGYRATNSITATGIGVPIGDTPATIDVVTSDFIDDTRSDLINDALRFVPGVTTQPTNESQPFVRGFQGGGYSLRNGVFRRQNLTTFDVDDVEVIQGPSSIFYSEIRPGGIINYNTFQPVFGQDFVTAEADTGDYNYRRGEVAVNAGDDQFAVRADVGTLFSNSFRTGYSEHMNFADIDLSWKPWSNQQVTLEYATESVARVDGWSAYISPATNSRYWENPAAIASGQSVSTWMAANYPGQPVYNEWAPFLQGTGDPYGRVTPTMTQYQAGLDKPLDLRYVIKLSDHLAFSSIVNYAWEDNEGINQIESDPLANDTFTNVYAQRFVNVRDSYNANLRLTYKVNVAGVDNTLMVGDDNSWIVQRYPQSAQPIVLSTTPGVLTSVNATNLNSAAIPVYNPLTYGIMNGNAMIGSTTPATAFSGFGTFNSLKDTEQFYGGDYLADQAVLFDRTLFLDVGDRYVDFRQRVWWPYRPDLEAHTTPDAATQKWTPDLGVLYKVAGGPFSLFYTYSESVVPQTQVDISGNAVTPIEAKGWDVGAKLDLLGGALTGTVDYYNVYETNTAIANSTADVAAGLPPNATYGYYTYGNPQQVKGLQADINYNLSKDFQLVFGVNEFYEAAYVAPNSNASVIGTAIAPLPATSYFVWNRYEIPSGALKGLVLGGGWRHNSESVVGSGSFNYTTFYDEGFTVVSAMIGYDFKAFGRPIKTKLLINNLGNEIYRDAGGAFGDPRTWVISASTRF
jgi:iron complex outermembrane recepter protein